MSELGDKLTAELATGIEDVFRRVEGGIVTKWLLIAETVGPDGERGLWTRTSDDLKPWESAGMLRLAQVTEENAWRRADDDEDDG